MSIVRTFPRMQLSKQKTTHDMDPSHPKYSSNEK